MFVEDALTFLVVLWLLFFVELIHLLPPDTILFLATPFNGFSWRQPPSLIGSKGIVFIHPLTIGAGMFITETTAPRFELASAHERLGQFSKMMSLIRKLSRILQLLTLIVLPLSILFFGVHIALVAFILVFFAINQFVARRAWRVMEIFLLSSKLEKIGIVAKIALYPIATILTVETLSLAILKEFHPVVVAIELNAKNWRKLAEISWRAANYPRPSDDFAAKLDERTFLEQFLESHQVRVNQLRKDPQQREAGALSYCPRCLTQFRLLEGTCMDCEGIPLAVFRE